MATTSYINGTTTNKYIKCRLAIISTPDPANNRSSVSVRLELRKSSTSTSRTWGTGYFRMRYGGNNFDYAKSGISIPADSTWRAIKTWNIGWVNHRSDGTMSNSVSLVNTGNYSGLPGTSYTDSYLSGTATLPKITVPVAPPVKPPVPGDPPPPVTHVITKSAGTGGAVTGPSSVSNGASAKYAITPNLGYSIAAVSVDGVQVGAVGTYTFANVTSAHSISATFAVIPEPPAIVDTFQSAHVMQSKGRLTKVRYHVAYDDSIPWPAHVKIYKGPAVGSPIYDGYPKSDVDIKLMRSASQGDLFTMVVETTQPVLGDAWNTDWFEARDDNTWTYLGYADDKLVGMTANNQLWNGGINNYELSNALGLNDPSPLLFSGLSTVGNVTISATATATETERVSVTYTVVNRFGPTKPAGFLTFYSSKPWSEWNTSNYVKLTGTASNGAGVLAVELYFAAAENQEPIFLGRVNVPDVAGDPLPATKPWSFNWTGAQLDTSSWLLANTTIPTENYTKGVPASKMSVLDGKLYFWGNSEFPYRVWFGGNPGSRFSVSPGTGGGFVDAEPGTGTVVTDVLKFKTQQGAAIVTILTDNANSQREARYNLVESSISISNEQSVQGLMAEKIAGAVGCKSEHGSVVGGDGLYAVSRYGLAITTLTMEYNSQLQVMYVSDAIEPVFLKQYGEQLKASVLLESNGVLYMTFGKLDGSLDNMVFCYDIGLKAWWTYTLDIFDDEDQLVREPILNMIHIDYEGAREGIGIITEKAVYLLPTTKGDPISALPDHDVLIETGELSTVQPLQSRHHLSQLEIKFDYFVGELDVIVKATDQFGREVVTRKHIRHDDVQYQLTEYIRVDQVVESYQVILFGKANFRLTHYNAKLYPKPMRIGMVYGFDSSQTHGGYGNIRRTFSSYNDVKKAIIP